MSKNMWKRILTRAILMVAGISVPDIGTATEDDKGIDPVAFEAEIKAKYEAEITARVQADINAKILKDATDKAKKDEENKLIDQVKNMIAKSEHKDDKVDEKIEKSRMNNEINDLKDLVKKLSDKLESETKEKEVSKTKDEIRVRIDKEPHLKVLVSQFLENGVIKSIEDYDRIVTKELKDTLKRTYDIEEKNKQSGKDPLSSYGTNTASQGVIKKKWNQTPEYLAQQEAINTKLGIRKPLI